MLFDPLWESVHLLCPLDRDALWRFERSQHRDAITANGTFNRIVSGGAFGDAAGRSGAGTASRGTVPHRAGYVFDGAFTVECRFYFGATNATRGILSKWVTTGNQRSWAIYLTSSTIQALLSTDGSSIAATLNSSVTPATDTWVHICLERNASNLVRLYVNGVVAASATVSGALFNNTDAPVELQGFNAGSAQAGDRIDEIRITKGHARYDGAFTPSSAPFPMTPVDYANLGGRGDRTSLITVTSSAILTAGSLQAAVNGVTTAGFEWTVSSPADMHITFDFGAPRIVRQAMLFKDSASMGTWRWQVSNNGTSWANVGDPFTLDTGSPLIPNSLRANTGAFRYYRLQRTSGVQSGTLWEVEFDIDVQIAPPVVTITSPANLSSHVEGTPISFEGTAIDAEDGDISAALVWESDVDGEIGTGASFSRDDLTLGTHVITAHATNSYDVTGDAVRTISVVVDAPDTELDWTGFGPLWDTLRGVWVEEPAGGDDPYITLRGGFHDPALLAQEAHGQGQGFRVRGRVLFNTTGRYFGHGYYYGAHSLTGGVGVGIGLGRLGEEPTWRGIWCGLAVAPHNHTIESLGIKKGSGRARLYIKTMDDAEPHAAGIAGRVVAKLHLPRVYVHSNDAAAAYAEGLASGDKWSTGVPKTHCPVIGCHDILLPAAVWYPLELEVTQTAPGLVRARARILDADGTFIPHPTKDGWHLDQLIGVAGTGGPMDLECLYAGYAGASSRDLTAFQGGRIHFDHEALEVDVLDSADCDPEPLPPYIPPPPPPEPDPERPLDKAWAFVLDGHTFYVINHVSGQTLIFDMQTRQWHVWQTRQNPFWNMHRGIMWKGRVLACDFDRPVVWELDPHSMLDEEEFPIERVVTGFHPVRGDSHFRQGSFRLSGELQEGVEDSDDAEITLRYSDDEGATWSRFYQRISPLSPGFTHSFRSLGTMRAPGRVWELRDVGALLKIEGADADADPAEEA